MQIRQGQYLLLAERAEQEAPAALEVLGEARPVLSEERVVLRERAAPGGLLQAAEFPD